MSADPFDSSTDQRATNPLPLLLVSACALIGVPLLLWLTREPSSGSVWPRWTAIMAVAWWLPGALLVAHWRLPKLDLPTAGLLALGLGWCWLVLGVLVVHWLPGPIDLPVLVAVYLAGDLVLAVALVFHSPLPLVPTPRHRWFWLLGLLLLAGVLRLPGLGYHEFHYDEVLVLTRAREAIRGEEDAFARHTKGPGELAAATVVFRTLGTADEATARLPFGLLSVGAVLAVAVLGLRLFGERTGFWSGLLLASNGFALGLSRIVQYQAAILLLMALAVLAGWKFATGGRARWLGLALLLSAFGVVMHYEFVLIAPALLWLFWLGRTKARRGALGRTLMLAGGAGTVLVAAAYLPTYLHPFFSTTQSYLGSRLGGVGRTANLAFFLEMGTFYNSVYFFVGLIVLVLGGLWMVRRQTGQLVLLLLWFAPYLLLYLFVIEFPGTHWYIFMAAWSILAAAPLAQWTAPERTAAVRWSAGVLAVFWLAVSVNYLHLMFFRQDPEYLANYATERVPFYWAPYGADIPQKPRFGFPILEGWKTLGVLSEWKYLNGTYASNERSRHLRWYAGDFERVPIDERPDFIFVARHLQEPEPGYSPTWLDGFQQIGDVRVRGEPRIEIWAREPLPVPYVVYDAALYDAIFMGQAPTFVEWPDPEPAAVDEALAGSMTLVEGGVAPARLRRGDILQVHLVWRAELPLPIDYKLFVHLAGPDGAPAAQWDGYPGLNTQRTSTWAPGHEFVDRVLLPIPDTMQPGEYRVLVGLYDPADGTRLGDRTVEVGVVEVTGKAN